MADSRVMIAAAKSGSGKTLITCALMRRLKEDGFTVAPYKCGPDYIDPMYHRVALGMPAQSLWRDGTIASGGNLDTYFTDEETTVRLLYEGGCGTSDIAVIEGVMGLYDGLGGTTLTGSSYELACVTGTPIILVCDVKGMGRSALAMVKGFLDYDTHHLIRGILLNRVSGMYYERLRYIIEAEAGVPVAGYVPEDGRLQIGSRHLGLVTPTEGGSIPHGIQAEDAIAAASMLIKDTVDIRAILAVAESAKALEPPTSAESEIPNRSKSAESIIKDQYADARSEKPERPMPSGTEILEPKIPLPFFPVRKIKKIAVATDEAFCFYYRENLRCLKNLGLDLIPFSPLHDEQLPEACDAILLGGGYPEEYLPALSANTSMKHAIRVATEAGCFVIAECGGFMYLQEAIEDRSGRSYPMVGVLPGTCRWQGRLTRFGYVELAMGDAHCKGHEFHYYDSDHNGDDLLLTKTSSGKTYRAMYATDCMLAGFAHLYYPSFS